MVGTNIYDKILLAQEFIDSIQKRKDAIISIKLDLSKYFNILTNLMIEYVHITSDVNLTLSFFYMKKIREVSCC